MLPLSSSRALPATGGPKTYSTDFSAAEDPLSESGAWLLGQREGRDWADVRTVGGNAIGKNRAVTYADPTAILAGTWAPDQEVEAVVFRTGTGTARREIELRLRATITPGFCRNYEVIFRAYNAAPNLQIVKWPGPLATSSSQFTFLLGTTSGVLIADGDVIKARIIGNTITAYINGILKATVMDNSSPITSGAPGFGFNYNYEGPGGEPGGYSNHGLKSLLASEI